MRVPWWKSCPYYRAQREWERADSSSRALLTLSLAAVCTGGNVHQKHHIALDMLHVTDYEGNCTAVLPICWYLSLVEKWGHTSPGAAALEYFQLLICVFVTCLVRNTHRWGINRCLLWAVSLLPVFSNIGAKSTGLATRPTGEQILATKCRQLFMSVCLSHASPK